MKCPECQFENPDAIKFCGECGAKLERFCPRCNAPNPPQFKFCGECGYQLSVPSKPVPKELSFEEKLAKIQKYLPGGLTEKILAQRGKIEGERKQVTVMFTDIEGFTTLVEKLGPEEAYSIMDQVFEILIHKVHEYGGTVNKMTGDGIMALFGAPIALEDAPQRAIRSASAIHREMVMFGEKLKQEKGLLPIRMRIGLHTGPVVVGTLGNDLRVEFTAIGDTVNLASRMEGLAEPGTTCVTEDTFKLTEGLFRFEALGEKQIKGKETPVKVYRVIAPSTLRTRFDVNAERGLTPFIGRERELELLLEGFERVKGGRGQAFSIMGEAGVGKSRILYEFRKAVANEDVGFWEGKCLSYGKGTAYHPIIDILKSNFDIQEGDEDPRVGEKVKRGLGVLRIEETSALPYLLELLSVKDSGIDRNAMSPEGKKERIIESLKEIILKGSEIRPLIMAIEDLHWIDKSSEDAMKYFLESIPGARVLLIFTYRPEFVHTWGGRSYHNQINLNRLSNRESLFMVAHLLGTQEVDRDLEKLILEKTEGVPFFIEELLKSLKDLKIIERKDSKYKLAKDVKAVAIPSTIQDMIMARVDSLPDATKTVLQTGSVIEREFTYDLIKRVTGLPEQPLLTHLSALKDSELLYERGIYPKSSYIFRHALTREIIYSSIMTEKRKELHEAIGKAIEEIYKETRDDYYGILAQHFILSENYEKGAEYSGRGARKAELSTYSLYDAMTHTRRRVFCIEKMPQRDEVYKKRIDARLTLAFYLNRLNHHAEAQEAILPILDLIEKQGTKEQICRVRMFLGAYHYFVEEDLLAAIQCYQEALTIAEEVKDLITLYLASNRYGVALGFNCEFERAMPHLERAFEICVSIKNLYLAAVYKSNLALLCYFLPGRINLGLEISAEAVRIAKETGNTYPTGIAYTFYGQFLHGQGLFKEAEGYLLKADEFCGRNNNVVYLGWANMCLGDNYIEMGNFVQAKGRYKSAIEVFEQNQLWSSSWLALVKAGWAKAMVMNKERDIDLESVFRLSRNIKIKAPEGCILRYIGEILLNIDDQHTSEAENWVQKAIDADQRNGMMFHLGRDFALYAEFFRRKGERLKAQENFGKAIGILKECGADGWVSKYEKELASIS